MCGDKLYKQDYYCCGLWHPLWLGTQLPWIKIKGSYSRYVNERYLGTEGQGEVPQSFHLGFEQAEMVESGGGGALRKKSLRSLGWLCSPKVNTSFCHVRPCCHENQLNQPQHSGQLSPTAPVVTGPALAVRQDASCSQM